MIIFVSRRRRYTDSHFKWTFTCRAHFWINWLNVFAVSSLRLWFRQLSFTACSAMKIAFHISGVIGISERRIIYHGGYKWLLNCSPRNYFCSFYPFELQVCRRKNLCIPNNRMLFLFFDFNGFWQENDVTGLAANVHFV